MLAPTVGIDAAGLGSKQKRFNQLVARIAKLRAALRTWLDVRDQIHRRAPERLRVDAEHRALVHEIVIVLDRSWSALNKTERKQVSELICQTAWDHLQSAPDDDEVKRIFNEHSGTDFDEERSADEAAQVEMMREVLSDHGIAVDHSIDNLDDLHAAAQQEAERQARAAAERAARRPRSKRQQTIDARRESAQVEASKALQSVYRALAMALHPDREPEAAERARKTELMVEVNAAYERRDLLALLELQLRVEQLDADKIAALAEDRLERFNRLLAEQAGQLSAELADVEHPFRMQLDIPAPRKLAPARVLAAFEDDLRGNLDRIASTRRDLQGMRDLPTLRRMLRDQRGAVRDEQEAMMRAMAALIRTAHATPRTPRRRR